MNIASSNKKLNFIFFSVFLLFSFSAWAAPKKSLKRHVPDEQTESLQSALIHSSISDFSGNLHHLQEWIETTCPNGQCSTLENRLRLQEMIFSAAAAISTLPQNERQAIFAHNMIRKLISTHIIPFISKNTLTCELGNTSELVDKVQSVQRQLSLPSPSTLTCTTHSSPSEHSFERTSTVSQCCNSIKTEEPINLGFPPTPKPAYLNFKHNPALDPYSTGLGSEGRPESWSYSGEGRYTRPRTIGGNFVPDAIRFTPPFITADQFSAALESGQSTDQIYEQYNQQQLHRALAAEASKDISKIVDRIGSGGYNTAYLRYKPGTDIKEFEQQLPSPKTEELRPFLLALRNRENAIAAWKKPLLTQYQKEHTIEVVKIRKPIVYPTALEGDSPKTVFDRFNKGEQEAADHVRRDLALSKAFEQCAAHYTIAGRPLIKVALMHQTPSDLQQGIFRQKAVIGGIEAYDIGELIKSKNETALKLKGFASIDDAKFKIAALEQFYRETHTDALKFHKKNNLPTVFNTTPSGALVEVGFDYNKGHNVLWDPQNQEFIAIDF